MDERLAQAVQWMIAHYRKVSLKNRKGMCLGTVRAALKAQGLTLPWNAAPENTALGCFADLKADPDKWGWQKVSHTLPRYSLVFFGNCGKLGDGRIAGHIAIYDQESEKLFADTPVKMNKWWGSRLKGAFVPK